MIDLGHDMFILEFLCFTFGKHQIPTSEAFFFLMTTEIVPLIGSTFPVIATFIFDFTAG